jgi:hypothetical protein
MISPNAKDGSLAFAMIHVGYALKAGTVSPLAYTARRPEEWLGSETRTFDRDSVTPDLSQSIGVAPSSAWYVLNLEGRVHLDVPPACDPISREDMKTHNLSIPTNLGPGFRPLPQ